MGEEWRFDRGIAQRVGHGRLRDAGDGDDVARLGEVDAGALEAAESQHFRHPRGLDRRAIASDGLDGLVGPDATGGDAARQDAAQIGVGLQRGRQHAERSLLHGRRRHVRHHQLEERGHVGLRPLRIGGHPAVAARAVEHGEVELLVGRIERGEQVEDLVEHRLVALVGTVDLVDDDDRPQALLQGLGDHELGLR